MRILLILILFGSAIGARLSAQITVVLTDVRGITTTATSGETLQLARHVTLRVGKDWVALRNEGPPRHWHVFASQWSPAVWSFRSLAVMIPSTWFPMGYPLNGAEMVTELDGAATWNLVSSTAPLLADPDLKGSDSYHVLVGGETIAWRFRDISDPLDPLPDEKTRKAALDLLALDEKPLESYPLLKQALLLHGGTTASLEAEPEAPRDLLWRLFASHWASASGESWPLEHWYLGGDVPWAEGSSNCHHDVELWPLVNALHQESGLRAQIALTLGLWLTRSKAEKGLIWSRRNRFSGWWQYEKGQLTQSGDRQIARRGRNYFPTTTKEWDRGLLVAATLAPKDPILKEAVALRREAWMRRRVADVPQMASGRYGVQQFSRPLWNLLVWWRYARAQKDSELERHCVALARALKNRGLGFAKDSLWMRDGSIGTGSSAQWWSPWMEADAIRALWAWSRPGMPLAGNAAERQLLTRMLQRLLDLGAPRGSEDWQIPHFVKGPPSWKAQTWGHPALNCWFHPLWDIARDLGIKTVSGVRLDEAARRSRHSGFVLLGRSWATRGPTEKDRLDHVGGIRDGFGSSDLQYFGGALQSLLR